MSCESNRNHVATEAVQILIDSVFHVFDIFGYTASHEDQNLDTTKCQLDFSQIPKDLKEADALVPFTSVNQDTQKASNHVKTERK